jgi:hypothetical protein
VIADGYDTKLTAFEVLIPALILSFNNLAKNFIQGFNRTHKYSKKMGLLL